MASFDRVSCDIFPGQKQGKTLQEIYLYLCLSGLVNTYISRVIEAITWRIYCSGPTDNHHQSGAPLIWFWALMGSTGIRGAKGSKDTLWVEVLSSFVLFSIPCPQYNLKSEEKPAYTWNKTDTCILKCEKGLMVTSVRLRSNFFRMFVIYSECFLISEVFYVSSVISLFAWWPSF